MQQKTSVLISAILLVTPGQGADCAAIVAERIRWVTAGNGNWVKLTMASHETVRDQLVTYAEGTISHGNSGQSRGGSAAGAASMWTDDTGMRPRGSAQGESETRHYFNDEKRCSESSSDGTCILWALFDPHKTDRLFFRIEGAFPALRLPGRIVMKLLSWGGGEAVMPLNEFSCTDQGLLVHIAGGKVSTFTFTKGNTHIVR